MDKKLIIDTLDTAGVGNTKNPRNRSRTWCFTYNNPEEKHKDIEKLLNDTSKYMFQLEIGDSKTEHYQGVLKYRNARSFDSMKKLLPLAHWEKCNNFKASVEYCRKDEGRVGGPWSKGFPKKIKIIKELYAWQQECINNITWDNDRQINWYWSEDGCKGKTALVKYICMKYNAILVAGSPKDAKYVVANHLDKNQLNADNLIIIWNFARSSNINDGHYQCMESLKDGIFVSTKYESKPIIMNSPHIIVFANEEPDTQALSEDRWRIKLIE